MGNRHSKPQTAELQPHNLFQGGVHGSHHVMGNVSGGIHYGSKEADINERLRPDVVFDAFYNSAKREEEHAVTCQPGTRTKVLDEVRSWANNTTKPICWLSGPAGTGKTTVAHTIAEEFDDRGQLAATFFFWRKTGDRDKIHKLVPTLAYQIAENIASVKKQLERELELKVPLSKLALENQLKKDLVLQHGVNVQSADFMFVVIDGLDECDSAELISKLITWLRSNTFPFRILLTSRPEPHITKCFRCNKGDVHSLSLTESKDDIRKYFLEQLRKIQEESPESHVSSDWPLKSDVNQLVEKSEGLFIYAATAIRYIGGDGFPVLRLESVLKLHVGLDSLYDQVVQDAKKWDYFDSVMGSIMYIRERLSVNELSSFLIVIDGILTSPVIRSALQGCHSILIIPNDDDSKIRFHHASLRDFLTNESRSKSLFTAPAKFHAQLLVGCLGGIKTAWSEDRKAPNYALASWHFHASMFLASTCAGTELEDLNDDTESLIQKIDKKWVESWITEALRENKFSSLKEKVAFYNGQNLHGSDFKFGKKITNHFNDSSEPKVGRSKP